MNPLNNLKNKKNNKTKKLIITTKSRLVHFQIFLAQPKTATKLKRIIQQVKAVMKILVVNLLLYV